MSKARSLSDNPTAQARTVPPPGARRHTGDAGRPPHHVPVRTAAGQDLGNELRSTRSTCARRVRPMHRWRSSHTGLVLRAVGYEVSPVPGLPYDQSTKTLAHVGGRLVEEGTDRVSTGSTASVGPSEGRQESSAPTRSARRRPSRRVIADLRAGRLAAPTISSSALDAAIRARQPHAVGLAGWASHRQPRTARRSIGRPAQATAQVGPRRDDARRGRLSDATATQRVASAPCSGIHRLRSHA